MFEGTAAKPGGHFVDPLIWMLLVVAFFLGPIKLLGTSWVGYLFPDSLAALILTLVLFERIALRKPLLAQSELAVPLVFLAGYCVLEILNPQSPLVRSMLGLRSWLLYLGFYLVGLYTFRSLRQLQRLYEVLLALGLITGLYGIHQWQVGPESFATWSEYYARYAHFTWSATSGAVFRAFSTFVLPNVFAENMALLILIAFSVVASPRVLPRWRIAAAGSCAVMGAGIAVSGSRGPVAHLLLATVASLIFVPGLRSKLKIGVTGAAITGVAVGVVGLVTGPIVSQRFSTIFDPQAFFWKWFGPLAGGLRVALEHPFGMGLGYTAGVPRFVGGGFFSDLPTVNIDSGYGSAAAELGLIGLLFFVYFAGRVGASGLRAWRSLPSGRLKDLLLGPALLAATYPIVSVIYQPQSVLPSSIYFWLLVGVLMKASRVEGVHDASMLLRAEMHSRQ